MTFVRLDLPLCVSTIPSWSFIRWAKRRFHVGESSRWSLRPRHLPSPLATRWRVTWSSANERKVEKRSMTEKFCFLWNHNKGDLLENYCHWDTIINIARLIYAINIMLTFPLECLVCRQVGFDWRRQFYNCPLSRQGHRNRVLSMDEFQCWSKSLRCYQCHCRGQCASLSYHRLSRNRSGVECKRIDREWIENDSSLDSGTVGCFVIGLHSSGTVLFEIETVQFTVVDG